ncbi:hypothetical protein, partial [Shigella flexneri]|uniref:hypothetical protein n=1 Tax=Shigella flexneri TaxID=623 RepID=UPI000AE222B0
TSEEMRRRLRQAQTAYGSINSVDDLIAHPQLKTRPMAVNGMTAQVPASPWSVPWESAEFAPAPALDASGGAVRREFAATPEATTVSGSAGDRGAIV